MNTIDQTRVDTAMAQTIRHLTTVLLYVSRQIPPDATKMEQLPSGIPALTMLTLATKEMLSGLTSALADTGISMDDAHAAMDESNDAIRAAKEQIEKDMDDE